VVACLVQQCEDQGIFADEWMESEATINPDKTPATLSKCLRVDYSSLRIDFIFDAGERGPKFRDKHFQNFGTGRRAAEGNIIRQGERTQHMFAVGHLERRWTDSVRNCGGFQLVVERSESSDEVSACVLKQVDRGLWGLPGWARPSQLKAAADRIE